MGEEDMEEMEADCMMACDSCDPEDETTEEDCGMCMVCGCMHGAAECDESQGENQEACETMVGCMDHGVYGMVLDAVMDEMAGDMVKYFVKSQEITSNANFLAKQH